MSGCVPPPLPRGSGLRRIAALCAVLAAAAACAPRAPAGPSLLLVTVDTLRADRLACYGGPPDLGRSACRLAEQGTRFAWAFAAAPFTAPSIASLLTSRYPSGHGLSQFDRRPLAPGVGGVAERLADAGWATAAFVSNPVLARGRRLDRGFDVYDDRLPRRERNRPGYAERVAADATDAALAWARGAPRPWFLWVHYQDPHGPYDPPGQPVPSDPPAAGLPLPASGLRLPALADHSGWQGIPRYQLLPGLHSLAAYEARYAEEIRYLDRHLGRLLDGLDALGAPPAVLFTADHGEAFGEDGYYFAHGHSLALDQIRVPLLWRGPAAEPGRVVVRPVSLLDVAPTLLVAAGLPVPASFEGRPLLGAGARTDAGEPFFAEHHERIAVVAGGRYFARDRRDLSGGVRDPNSEGLLRPLPPRTAQLPADGSVPAYRGADGDEPGPQLAELVDRFLAERPAPPRGGPMDPQTRKRLEALGYVEPRE